MKYISSLAICLILTSSALANKEIAPYSQESCQEIYGAIGTFLYLADKEWKKENEKIKITHTHLKNLIYSTSRNKFSSCKS